MRPLFLVPEAQLAETPRDQLTALVVDALEAYIAHQPPGTGYRISRSRDLDFFVVTLATDDGTTRDVTLTISDPAGVL